MIDRLGSKRALSLAVFWWSVAAGAHAFARGLSPTEGWQAAFIVPAALGFAWVWLWRRHFHLPEHDPAIGAEERALVTAEQSPAAILPTATRPLGAEMRSYVARLLYWFRYRQTWGLTLARFTADGAFYFLAFWIPNYLSDVRGFGLKEIAWAAAIPFVFADLGSLIGGYTGQRLIAAGWSVDASRKALIWIGALLVPLALPAVYVDSAGFAVLLMGLGIFGIQVKSASLFVVPADIYPPAAVATVWGASGAAGSLAAAFSQPVIGWMIDRFSYQPVFVAVALMHVVSALCVMLLVRSIEPVALKPGMP